MNSFEEYARNKAAHILKAKNIAPLAHRIRALPPLEATMMSENGIHLRAHTPLSDNLRAEIESLARALKPWRKGPFHLFDLHIDSEWQSFMKWQLLAPHLSLSGKKIADVGCNNGYYMFEMLLQSAQEAGSKAHSTATTQRERSDNRKTNMEADSQTSENDLTTKRSAVVGQSFRRTSGVTSAVQDPAARSAAAGHSGSDNSEAIIESRRDSECPPQGFRRRSGIYSRETIPRGSASDNHEVKTNSEARIIGFDPSGIFKCQFDFINHFARAPIGYELLGVEDLERYCELHKSGFDMIFCLGVLYHRLSPIETLKSLSRSLESGGELILDTLIYESNEELCLSPAKTYARMSNVYFIPSISTLQGWCERAKLRHFEILALMPTTTLEQRQTPWVDSQSLESFLQQDKTLTIEGYQPPIRGYFRLKKE